MHTSFWLRPSNALLLFSALLAYACVAATDCAAARTFPAWSAETEIAHRALSPATQELIEDCLNYPTALTDEDILAIISQLTDAADTAATVDIRAATSDSTTRTGLGDPNDNFASATTITLPAGDTAPQIFTGDSAFSTKEPGEPNHDGETGGHSLWWKWTPAGHVRVSLYSVNSSIPTVLAVYTGSAVNNLTVVPRDAYTAPVPEAYFFNALQRVTYYFAIDGVGGATGKLELHIATIGATPPSITTQPVDVALTLGVEAYVRMVAAGSTPMSYQWYRNGVALPLEVNASCHIYNPRAADAGSYYVIVSNPWGSVVSNSVAVTFPIFPGPTITEQPGPQRAPLGGNTQFSVKATGDGTLTYQWRLNGTPIAGATSATLTISKAKSSDFGTYTVVVTDTKGSVTSNGAELQLLENANPPQITEQPKSQTVTVGANVTLQVTATSDVPLSYLWVKNAKVLGSEISATLTLNNVQSSDAGSYFVNVSNAHGTVASATVTLTVNQPPPTPPASTGSSSGGGGGGAPSVLSLLLVSALAASRRWTKRTLLHRR